MRLHEYSPGFDPQRFDAHEESFVEDVSAWVQPRLGVTLSVGRTAVLGVSAGGVFALAVVLRHPGFYGATFSASPGGGYRPPNVTPSPLPRTYLVAGTLESLFLQNAARWAAAPRDIVMRERVASHDGAMWREELPRMLDWRFSRPDSTRTMFRQHRVKLPNERWAVRETH